MKSRLWRVGELARATGTTVRALHHYEETGLLAPAGRSSGNHRLYDEADVERLYRISALRGLGMSLDEIRQVIDDGSILADLLQTHLRRVESKVDRMILLRDRLRSIAKPGKQVSADDLLATLEAMSRIERHAHQRRPEKTAQENDIESQWHALADRLRSCMSSGEQPSSKPVIALAAQARALMESFADGDAEVLGALARLRAVDPPRDLAGWTPELIRYLDLSLAALEQYPATERKQRSNENDAE